MKTHLIAAEIARLVPQMAQDSAVNNETLIRNMLERELEQSKATPEPQKSGTN